MEGYQLHSVRSASVNVFSVLTTLAVFFSIVYVALFKWRRRRLEKLASQLPGPPALPVIGNGLEFLGGPEEVMAKILALCSRYESPFRIWMGPILLIMVSDPDNLQIVLNSSKTLEKGSLYRFFRDAAGTGLFTAPVDKWKRNRRAITPAFNTRLLEQFMPVFNQQNRLLVAKLGERVGHGLFDVWDYVSPATFDIICQTALGVDVKAQDNPESDFAQTLSRVIDLGFKRIYKFWLHPNFIFNRMSYGKELRQAYKQLHALPNAVIQQKKEEFRKKKEAALKSPQQIENPDDKGKKGLKVFLDILLELNDGGNTFTDDDLRDEVVTMMVGGSETSAMTDCFCLLMLAMHEDIQDKVFEEVYNIFGNSGREVTMEDLDQMVYLEMVLKETLRMFPIAPVFLRQVKEDIELTNYILPAGCNLGIVPIATHMNPTLYTDPKRFNPERFSPENLSMRHRYSFISFSGGPRGCIGLKFAMLSMKTTISTILRNYKLSTSVKMEDIKLKFEFLMKSVDGFRLRLEPRQYS
ncbi:cytochrome P450 4C1-like [Homalodisca vitripennis]|uniref:cytochrome P450 4C1-like n=1 Tax=Homalodisca vitripennis TaxID=197043 RepID=UPI001EEB8879|nr:cytochrome P450 4C1-like [Homalodisca vitripennis]